MSSSKNKPAVQKETSNSKQLPANAPFVFGKMNYVLTIVSLLVLTLGFVLMTGKEGDIYDFRRITLAPIVVIIGFSLGFVAIFYKQKSSDSSEQ